MRRLLPALLAVSAVVAFAPPAAAAGPSPIERARSFADGTAVKPSEVRAPGTVEGAAPPAAGISSNPAPPPVTAAPGDPARAAALQRRVMAALAGSGARTVAVAVDVDGFGALVRRDSEHALPPASTQKSFTATAALLALGPDVRFRTEVASTVRPTAGRLPGSVWLVAGGDPYLTSSGLTELARSVRAAGVTSIAGDLRLDDSRYDSRRNAAGWARSYVPRFSGPLSALAVDGNTWRTDRTFLADPAFPAAVKFRDALRAAGVSVGGTVRRERRPVTAKTVAVRESGPMSAVVRRILKSSDNFAAELLLKEVGRAVRGQGSSAAGIAATRDVLGPRGVAVGSGADGSGLSALNRQTPAGQLQLLHAAERSPIGPTLRAALPLGCRDGTLRRRFCSSAGSGRVSAKTGTLVGARALAGYTRTASGRDVTFAFQLTGVSDGNRALAAIDRAVVVLAGATE